MNLKAGIVGLPNVGKSTLFKALTNEQIEIANYPFATIDANVGIVEVNDERLNKLVSIFSSKKRIAATFEFVDIAGLVKGASKGAGLGNQFLGNIREVDAIIQVVRCFDDDDIIHVDNSVNPLRDIETINLELIFADLDTIEKRIARNQKKAMSTKERELMQDVEISLKIKKALEEGKLASLANLEKHELELAKTFNLLTTKSMILVANTNTNKYHEFDKINHYQQVKEYALKNNIPLIGINARVEEELSDLESDDKKIMLDELGISESGLDIITKTAYHILGLRTFFTAGESESRAWTYIDGMKAKECAGIIHTDFEKGFIKAEVYSYNDLVTYVSEKGVKEAGKLRLEGKDYLMEDGDIVHFRFNL